MNTNVKLEALAFPVIWIRSFYERFFQGIVVVGLELVFYNVAVVRVYAKRRLPFIKSVEYSVSVVVYPILFCT